MSSTTFVGYNGTISPIAIHVDEHAGRLRQCDVSRSTARSHFLLFRSKRNQHRFEGGGGKTLHHHVLQPKSSTHHVHLVLAKACQTQTNVLDQDDDIDLSMHHSVHSKDFKDLWVGPQ